MFDKIVHNGCSRYENNSNDTIKNYTEDTSIMNGSPNRNELSDNTIIDTMTVTTNNEEYTTIIGSQKTANVTITPNDYFVTKGEREMINEG